MGLYTLFPECDYCMDGTVVELYSLSYPDRSCPEDKNFLPVCGGCLTGVFVSGIVVGSCCLELGCTGVHHFEGSENSVFMPEIAYFLPGLSGQLCKAAVREAHLLYFAQEFRI